VSRFSRFHNVERSHPVTLSIAKIFPFPFTFSTAWELNIFPRPTAGAFTHAAAIF
jgi:hypothetical protein